MNWFIDSDASMHMTMRDDWLKHKVSPEVKEIVLDNNSKLQVTAMGTINFRIYSNGSVENIQIRNVLLVPGLSTNLLSVSRIVKNGYKIEFFENICQIFNNRNDVVADADLVENMYKLNVSPPKTVTLWFLINRMHYYGLLISIFPI
ncbi:hypothetical protein JTB14_015689 [Gonioctena quinquepunctata]|nr:hypothetical protein JTB14_015689 [Gonioctena quinquepunctata]